MSQTIQIPRGVSYQAQLRLMRAEEAVASISALYSRVAKLFAPRPAATDADALNIARAWLMASA